MEEGRNSGCGGGELGESRQAVHFLSVSEPCLEQEIFLDLFPWWKKKTENLLEIILGNHSYFYLNVQELVFNLRTEMKTVFKKKKKKCQLYVLISF